MSNKKQKCILKKRCWQKKTKNQLFEMYQYVDFDCGPIFKRELTAAELFKMAKVTKRAQGGFLWIKVHFLTQS